MVLPIDVNGKTHTRDDLTGELVPEILKKRRMSLVANGSGALPAARFFPNLPKHPSPDNAILPQETGPACTPVSRRAVGWTGNSRICRNRRRQDSVAPFLQLPGHGSHLPIANDAGRQLQNSGRAVRNKGQDGLLIQDGVKLLIATVFPARVRTRLRVKRFQQLLDRPQLRHLTLDPQSVVIRIYGDLDVNICIQLLDDLGQLGCLGITE